MWKRKNICSQSWINVCNVVYCSVSKAAPSPFPKKPSDLNYQSFLGSIGTSSDPEITKQAVEASGLNENKDITGMQRGGSKFAASKSSRTHILII